MHPCPFWAACPRGERMLFRRIPRIRTPRALPRPWARSRSGAMAGLCGVCPSRCGLMATDQARGHCQAGALAKSFGATDSTRSELGSVAPKVFDTRLTVVAGLVAIRSGHTERDGHHAPRRNARPQVAIPATRRSSRYPATADTRASAPRAQRHTPYEPAQLPRRELSRPQHTPRINP